MFDSNLPARWRKLLLAGISLLLAAVIRIVDLQNLPNGLHWDEMDTGYQANSLFRTGKDYFSNPLPLFPHSFADYRTPVYIYSAVPIIAKLGLSAVSVRFVSVIWGLLGIILIYLLTKDWIAPAVVALSPWHVQYSRKAVETISLSTLFLAALACFLRGLRHPRWLILSGLFFGLSMAAYSPGKLFIPLFLIVLIFIYRKSLIKISSIHLLASIISFSLIAVPVGLDSIFGKSGTRFHDVAVFTDPTRAFEINLRRLDTALSSGQSRKVGLKTSAFAKLLDNKIIDITTTIANSYLQTFSTEFLFIKGDPEPRHSPSKNTIGQLHLPEILPLIIGLYHLPAVLIPWILLSPIPAALTRDGGNHAARLLIMFPAFAWVITLGIRRLQKIHPLLSIFYFLVFMGSSFYIFGYYFTHYRFESAQPYQWGFSQMAKLAYSKAGQYDRVILDFGSDSALMAYLFTNKIPPRKLNFSKQILNTETPDLGNIYLLPPGSRSWSDIVTQKLLSGRNLVIAAANTLPNPGVVPAPTRIDYPNSQPAFYTFEINQ